MYYIIILIVNEEFLFEIMLNKMYSIDGEIFQLTQLRIQ
jgi:hypothetical protein